MGLNRFKGLLFIIAFLILGADAQAQNKLHIPDTLSGNQISLNLQKGSMVFFPGDTTKTFGANGNFLGPTLILQRNQNVAMLVTNQLDDTTTLHWHGMHVSPKNDGSPHITIPPGTTWKPAFKVLDWAGTYWYHPHMHMHTNAHVMKGIAGMIIVRDSHESALGLPVTYGVDDFPVVVQTRSFDANKQIVINDALDSTVIVNGTIKPFLEAPAQYIRLRLLNGSSERVYQFGFSNNLTFHQITSDGGLLTAPVALTRLRMAPGERADILVNLAAYENQTVVLRSYGSELPSAIYGAAQPGMGPGQTIPGYSQNALNGKDFNILEIRVGAPTAGKITTIPGALVQHNIWSVSSADTTRPFVFMSANMGPTAIQGPFMINNTHFNMNVINEYVPFNNTEIWELRNQSPIAHPFHMHNVHFYIVSINGAAPPPNMQGRKDVVLVPAGNTTVRIITRFEDFYNDTFPYMYHCHMLTHEDHGMMGQYIVKSPPNAALPSIRNNDNISLYPNPANDKLHVSMHEIFNGTVRIVSTKGVVIEEKEVNGKRFAFNTLELASGLYYLQGMDSNINFDIPFIISK